VVHEAGVSRFLVKFSGKLLLALIVVLPLVNRPPDVQAAVEVAKLTASDAAASDYFGNSVAISGDTAIVGAYGNGDAGDRSGSAYVYLELNCGNGVLDVGEQCDDGNIADGDGCDETCQREINLAVNRPVTASLSHPSAPAPNAVDGLACLPSENNQTCMVPAWNAGSYPPQWLEVNLQEPTTLTAIRYQPDMTGMGLVTEGLDVEHLFSVKKEGSSVFVPLTTFTGTVDSTKWITIPLAPPEADVRYLKIEVTSISPNSWVALYELELYGYTGTTSTTTTSTSTTSTTTTTLPAVACGDPTEDGEITAADALATLQAAVGLTVCDVSRCDTNGDGQVTALDALRLLQYAVGLDVVLNCEVVPPTSTSTTTTTTTSTSTTTTTVVGVTTTTSTSTTTTTVVGGTTTTSTTTTTVTIPLVEQKLIDLNPGASDQFGNSVALSGSRAIVGAKYDDCPTGQDCGSVVLFERDSQGTWHQVGKVSPADIGAGDSFGYSVSLSGDSMLVGAPFGDGLTTDSGAAYVFKLDQFGLWSEQAKLVGDDVDLNDRFGVSVSLSGDTALVGAHGYDVPGVDSGAAYIFERDGAGAWTQSAKLVSDDPHNLENFGVSVALFDDTALIGKAADDFCVGYANSAANCGSAYVFEREGLGSWTQSAKLVADDAATGDFFGISVALTEGLALVGSYYDDCSMGNDCGAAYVFDRDQAGNWSWTRQTKIIADDAAADDRFGYSTSLSGNKLAVGAVHADCGAGSNCGAAYVFESDGLGGWLLGNKLVASDGSVDDVLGVSVALSGDVALVGALGDECAEGNDCGAAYIMPTLP
jgi:cysteine-rich repeat protein